MIDVGATMYASAGIENTKTRKNMGMRLIISVFLNEKCRLLLRALMAVARNMQHRQMERCTRFSNWRFCLDSNFRLCVWAFHRREASSASFLVEEAGFSPKVWFGSFHFSAVPYG